MARSNIWYLHRTLINQQTVELRDSFTGAAGLAENNGCYPTANTIGAIGDHGALDRANRLSEIFLYERSLVPN